MTSFEREWMNMHKYDDFIICSNCGKIIPRQRDARKSKPFSCECGAIICAQCGMAMDNRPEFNESNMICFRPWWLCSFEGDEIS